MRTNRVLQLLLLLTVFSLVTVGFAQATDIPWKRGGKTVYLQKKADNFIILYDSSASMGDDYPGTHMTQLQVVRRTLLEKNATLPDMNWQAGIYSFTPANSLQNLIEYYPMQQYDKKKFSSTLLKNLPLEPAGATMLQLGLAGLDKVLMPLTGRTVIFLFSDGQYSHVESWPSPGELARRLAQKYDICFVVINAANDKEDIGALKRVAAANSCSSMVPVSKLFGNPEWMTNTLFQVVDRGSGGDMVKGHEWDSIHFEFDKAEIKKDYHPLLEEIAAFLAKNTQARIVLQGHTDNLGSREYNLKLSHRRASNVRNYLVKMHNVDPARITLTGFGADMPVSTNTTPEGRATNRRVVAIITGM